MKKFMLIIGLLLVTGSDLAGQTLFRLDGFNYGNQTDWQDGYPYYASINNGQDVFVMGDDWLSGPPLGGSGFTVYETNLGSGDLSELRFISGGVTSYLEAGWLVWDTQQPGGGSGNWTAMNQAVWHIFEPNSAPCAPGSACQYWLGLAEESSNYNTFPLNEVEVFTPIDMGANEGEYLCLWSSGGFCYPSAPPVPEPGTFFLLSTGLLGWVGRRLLS